MADEEVVLTSDTYTVTESYNGVAEYFIYAPVNLDRHFPLWRRIWWRLRYR